MKMSNFSSILFCKLQGENHKATYVLAALRRNELSHSVEFQKKFVSFSANHVRAKIAFSLRAALTLSKGIFLIFGELFCK